VGGREPGIPFDELPPSCSKHKVSQNVLALNRSASGIVVVAARAAIMEAFPPIVAITATGWPTGSVAIAGNRS
jgi:hypothetical protein